MLQVGLVSLVSLDQRVRLGLLVSLASKVLQALREKSGLQVVVDHGVPLDNQELGELLVSLEILVLLVMLDGLDRQGLKDGLDRLAFKVV